jgi:hypothetical protein
MDEFLQNKAKLQVIAAESSADDPKVKLDPFDFAALRLDQNFIETGGAKRLLTTVPVRKPDKQQFFRVHPDREYRLEPIGLIQFKEDRETYLVQGSIARQLSDECTVSRLYTAITRQGVVFLWPVPLPGSDGRVSEWHRSQDEAAIRAQKKWMRVKANMTLGAYEMFEATATIPEPEWPEFTFPQLLEIAFRNRLVDRGITR